MPVDALLLLVGLALLLGGGETVVRGATGLARSMEVSPLAIGLTVVAFGTSAPELAVNATAALRGRGEISFGNIIGSNMANIGLIVGCTAIMRPIAIQSVVVSRELPMMLLATAAAMVMAFDGWLSTGPDSYDRADGLLLLMLFLVFLYYTVGDIVSQRAGNDATVAAGAASDSSRKPLARSLLLTLVGLVALIGGAQVTVNAAVSLARWLDVSEVIIGLTLLAVGTSLPELVASIVASLRGHVELAIGNIVGSNIFNLLLVCGVTAVLRPIPIPPVGDYDLLVLAFLSCLLMGVSATNLRQIVRTEAVLLLASYLGYMAWRAGFSARL